MKTKGCIACIDPRHELGSVLVRQSDRKGLSWLNDPDIPHQFKCDWVLKKRVMRMAIKFACEECSLQSNYINERHENERDR